MFCTQVVDCNMTATLKSWRNAFLSRHYQTAGSVINRCKKIYILWHRPFTCVVINRVWRLYLMCAQVESFALKFPTHPMAKIHQGRPWQDVRNALVWETFYTCFPYSIVARFLIPVLSPNDQLVEDSSRLQPATTNMFTYRTVLDSVRSACSTSDCSH